MKFQKFMRHLVVAVLLLVSLAVQAQHHPRFDTIRERISNWEYPSIYGAWHAHRFLNLQDDFTQLEISRRLNLQFGAYVWRTQFRWDFEANRMQFVANDLPLQLAEQQQVIALNPNYIELTAFNSNFFHNSAAPASSDVWVRDANGNRIRFWQDNWYLFDFTHPHGQASLINIVVNAAETGLYDGVFFDYWFDNSDVLRGHRTLAAQQEARLNILRGIREKVHPDFLLLGNANVNRLPLSAPYMNGIMMETVLQGSQLFSRARIFEVSSTLRWASENMRTPTINCLHPVLSDVRSGAAPEQQRQMRLFTTMVLTQSDDLILFNSDRGNPRWYAFWDVKLGRPIGQQAQTGDHPSVYIREFERGWAVYNSGREPHFIELPAVTTSVATGKVDYIHEVGDLDGDMFFHSHPTNVHPGSKLTTLWGKIKSQ